MVTALAWSFLASVEISIFATGSIREPSSLTCSPSTNTQPRSIHRSASRREHSPRSDITLDSRTPSGGGPFGASGGLAADGTSAALFAQGFSRSATARAGFVAAERPHGLPSLRSAGLPSSRRGGAERPDAPGLRSPLKLLEGARPSFAPRGAEGFSTLGATTRLRTLRVPSGSPGNFSGAAGGSTFAAGSTAGAGASALGSARSPVATDSAGLRQRAQGSPWPSLP